MSAGEERRANEGWSGHRAPVPGETGFRVVRLSGSVDKIPIHWAAGVGSELSAPALYS